MPVERSYSGADRLLQVLGHPPIILFFEIADGNEAGAGTDGELAFGGRPAHKRGGAVDTEEYESGLPAGGRGFPDVGIAILFKVS